MFALAHTRIALIEAFFRLKENQTSVRSELLGGLTTFITMAYIVDGESADSFPGGNAHRWRSVRDLHLGGRGDAGHGAVRELSHRAGARHVAQRVLHLLRLPEMHVPWRTALGVIFLSGVVFLILTVTRVREQIVNGIPDCLKHSTAGGIGMFIAFVGLRNANLVVANPATFVSLGNLRNHEAQLACVGLGIILILMTRKITGAILIGVLGTTLLGILRGMSGWPKAIFSWPHPSATWLQLDIARRAAPGPCSRSCSSFSSSICSTMWELWSESANRAAS